jgi:nucleotide-binding universal stress UspA family protein
LQSNTIVLATRVGDESRGPARVAVRLAQDLGARLALLYIALELETIPVIAAGAGLDEDALRRDMITRAENLILDFFSEELPRERVDVIVTEGDIVEEIVKAAGRLNARFLVVGGKGRSGIARLILGDTTRSILQRSPCPVIVVPMSAEFAEG